MTLKVSRSVSQFKIMKNQNCPTSSEKNRSIVVGTVESFFGLFLSTHTLNAVKLSSHQELMIDLCINDQTRQQVK